MGRIDRRRDLAALAVLFTFGAVLNAFAMTAPAIAVERWIAGVLSVSSEPIVLAALFILVLVVVPATLFGVIHLTTSAGTSVSPAPDTGPTLVWLAYALVPLGVGVWAAHYGFHLLTGAFTIVPVTQSAVIDLTGRATAGEPMWTLTGMRPGLVYPLQLGAVLLGSFGSAALVQRMATRLQPGRARMLAIPWTLAVIVLAVAAAWILAQPMDMRGMSLPG